MWFGSEWILFSEGRGHILRDSKKLETVFVVFCFHNDSFRSPQDITGYTCPPRWGGGAVQDQV